MLFCNSLISLQISDRVTNIGACAFGECDNLRSIKIIKGTEQTKVPEKGSIKDGAFYLCYNLEEVTIAFPCISTGVYGYPKEEAADVAIKTVKEFNNDRINVIFVCFEDKDYEIYTRKLNQ